MAEGLAELEELDIQRNWRELGAFERWVLRRWVLRRPALRYYLRARFQAEAYARVARQLRMADPDRTPTAQLPAVTEPAIIG